MESTNEQRQINPNNRQSTSSQTTTIVDSLDKDDETLNNDRRLSKKDSRSEKPYEFDYSESIPTSPYIHPHDTDYEKTEHIETVRGQERITIVEGSPLPRNTVEPSRYHEQSPISFLNTFKQSKCMKWVKRQFTNDDNRYALQMSVAFTIAATLVMIEPFSSLFPNTFWIGVSVVTVLDTTVGGFLSLSFQRFFGTIIGGAASIVVMTITRAMFHPKWEWTASVVLACFMFIQIFFIAKLKTLPNMAYSGSIGLLTTCIILLSGYPDLIHDRLSLTAELGAWRILDLIIGIVISLIVSLIVFPVKASSILRRNLGKSIEDAADLYEKSSAYYLDFSGDTTRAVDESLAAGVSRRVPENDDLLQQSSIGDIISRLFSIQPPENNCPELRSQFRQQIEEVNQFWTHDKLTNFSNEAFGVLVRLQTESARLRNVASESKAQILFHIFGGGKERCKQDLRRAKRYNEAIEGMKRVVWPLVSFRLLLPLISASQANQQMEDSGYTSQLQERIRPTREALESFKESLKVMQKLGRILKDHTKPLSDFSDEWLEIDRMVTAGSLLIQRDLKQTIKASMHNKNMDGLKLLSYYGFLVRCCMIWDGLKTVVEKLSPMNGTLSRASSMNVNLPNREIIHAPD